MKKMFLLLLIYSIFHYNASSQQEKLEISGAIQIDHSEDPTPEQGTIRWNPDTEDFEAYMNSSWVSLTRSELPKYFGSEKAKLNEYQKLLPHDGAADDDFGISVGISGDYAIVGASGDDDSGSNSGSAYIFHHTGSKWVQQSKLGALDGAAEDLFGYSVSISGDYAIIGAWGDDYAGHNGGGSAYIFYRDGSTWTQQAKLIPPDASSSKHFGINVIIDGDYALIGAIGDNTNGSYSGAAYVFHRSDATWTHQAKLLPDDGATNDWFGLVSLHLDYALVGCYNDDDNGSNSGSAYVFHRDGSSWTQQAKLLPDDGTTGDRFGSVSIAGNYAFIGSPGDDDKGDNSGSSYIFHRTDTMWSQVLKIYAPDGAAGDAFGRSYMDDDYVIISSYTDDDNGSNSGSAYIFYRTGNHWIFQGKIAASDGDIDDYFGEQVSISGQFMIIGASGDDDSGEDSGAAYIY